MLVTELGIVTEVNAMHPEKACLPISVTLSLMTIDVSPLQPENAQSPIFVTEFGIVTEVNAEHPEKTS